MLDPSFTLFGKRIQVNGETEVDKSNFVEFHDDQLIEEVIAQESMENDQPDISSEEVVDESENAPEISQTSEQMEKTADLETHQDEKESNDTKKELKKPDKIIPCPRCNSMDTKFCYYNNYNVNQPRHFCKKCQRYWTAGGTMRNVPVGAGRRKNKTSASRYCQITVSEALQGANGVHHHPGVKNIGTVLTFGPDNPVCDSAGPVHNISDSSSGSTVTTVASTSMEDRSKKGVQETNQHFNGFPNQMQCFQWPYMWNPNPAVPFYPSAFPMPIYPHPYWNGAPFPCNPPWVPNQTIPEPTPNPPALGKRTRDDKIISPSVNDSSSVTTNTVLIPKTLRIDDPDEAAKSSIWTTLGIKNDKCEPTRKGFFNSIHSKGFSTEKNDSDVEMPSALIKANPVALCRSFTFQERA